MTLEEKTKKARDATVGRILSDDDFRKIAAAQLRKQVEGVRKGKKVPQKKGVKRTASEANMDDDGWINDSDDEEATGREELVNLDAIEMIHKKKSFSMMKHKIKTKGKKSFREKQQALKKRLIK